MKNPEINKKEQEFKELEVISKEDCPNCGFTGHLLIIDHEKLDAVYSCLKCKRGLNYAFSVGFLHRRG